MLHAAIFDLDGVIRQFDREGFHLTAKRHGFTMDHVFRAAFERGLGRELVTGRLTRAEWVQRVGVRLGSSDAAAELLSDIGQVDRQVLTLIRSLRASGTPVAILTNGTDTIAAELTRLGILQDFDLVISTWDIGVAKPDAGAFEAVCSRLGVAPSQAFFTDDRIENVEAAEALGLHAHHFSGPTELGEALVMAGLLP